MFFEEKSGIHQHSLSHRQEWSAIACHSHINIALIFFASRSIKYILKSTTWDPGEVGGCGDLLQGGGLSGGESSRAQPRDGNQILEKSWEH